MNRVSVSVISDGEALRVNATFVIKGQPITDAYRKRVQDKIKSVLERVDFDVPSKDDLLWAAMDTLLDHLRAHCIDALSNPHGKPVCVEISPKEQAVLGDLDEQYHAAMAAASGDMDEPWDDFISSLTERKAARRTP
jgi:hypothetical protein